MGYLVLLLFEGRAVNAWGAFVLELMNALVGGAILAMIYFSEFATKFIPFSEWISAEKEKAA
jgi:hypothetical protein